MIDQVLSRHYTRSPLRKQAIRRQFVADVLPHHLRPQPPSLPCSLKVPLGGKAQPTQHGYQLIYTLAFSQGAFSEKGRFFSCMNVLLLS